MKFTWVNFGSKKTILDVKSHFLSETHFPGVNIRIRWLVPFKREILRRHISKLRKATRLKFCIRHAFMDIITHAKFHLSWLMVVLIFGIWVSEPHWARWTTEKARPDRVKPTNIIKFLFGSRGLLGLIYLRPLGVNHNFRFDSIKSWSELLGILNLNNILPTQ